MTKNGLDILNFVLCCIIWINGVNYHFKITLKPYSAPSHTMYQPVPAPHRHSTVRHRDAVYNIDRREWIEHNSEPLITTPFNLQVYQPSSEWNCTLVSTSTQCWANTHTAGLLVAVMAHRHLGGSLEASRAGASSLWHTHLWTLDSI